MTISTRHHPQLAIFNYFQASESLIIKTQPDRINHNCSIILKSGSNGVYDIWDIYLLNRTWYMMYIYIYTILQAYIAPVYQVVQGMEKAVEEAKEHHEGKVGWPKSVEANCLKIGYIISWYIPRCLLANNFDVYITSCYIAIRYILH